MVRLSTIYTRSGDSGEAALGDGTRHPKHAPRFEAIGAVDEANAAIGLARVEAGADDASMLARLQNDLFDLGADLCLPEGDGLRITPGQVACLEAEIDAMNAALPPLSSFVLPGGSALAARLHQARTIVRRAERRIVALAACEPVTPAVLAYVNRLSDHLFVLARKVNSQGAGEILWVPGGGAPS